MQGIHKTNYGNDKQILAVVDPQVSFGVIVDATNVTAGSDGKKIVKAGTPMTGSLTARDTAFAVVKLTEGSTTGTEANVTGVLLHDVDVTSGDNNGTLLVFGYVKEEALDSDVKALWTTAVKTALNAKVTLVNTK